MLKVPEVKTESPSGWKSDYTWEQLFPMARAVGDIISVHTESPWGGSLDRIRQARKLTSKPILAKGLHRKDSAIADALEAGADLVLVEGRLPGVYLERCLIEPSSLEQLLELPPTVRAVWNSRDLVTYGLKAVTFAQAREAFSGWLCQASNIETLADVHPGADAFLFGTCMPQIAVELGYSRALSSPYHDSSL